MNLNNRQPSAMHFKSAQIAGVELSSNDLALINHYSLSPLTADEIFAFKVSMAANEIDRDFEVFPRETLAKLADLFVGKTVVKDHDHRSDNQLARIFSTELVSNDHMHLTRAGEVMTELIAKCYMIRTSKNADVIAEIQAGIRKEVSLGCRIGKAVCSICGTDNVKTYCAHFAGKQYDGKVCYFSLQEPKDAYELSFVAIPAQQHAGTVKSYGSEPCYQKDLMAKKQGKIDEENAGVTDKSSSRLMINRGEENQGETQTKESASADGEQREAATKAQTEASAEGKAEATQVHDEHYERLSAELSELSSKVSELVELLTKNAAKEATHAEKDTDNAAECTDNAANDADNAANSSETAPKEEKNSPESSTETGSEDGEKSKTEDTSPTPEKSAKDIQAQARLRALEMAIAMQKNTK